MARPVKHIRTIASKLSSIDIIDGQLIYVTDTKQQFLDVGLVRIEFTPSVQLTKQYDITVPTNGFLLNSLLRLSSQTGASPNTTFESFRVGEYQGNELWIADTVNTARRLCRIKESYDPGIDGLLNDSFIIEASRITDFRFDNIRPIFIAEINNHYYLTQDYRSGTLSSYSFIWQDMGDAEHILLTQGYYS